MGIKWSVKTFAGLNNEELYQILRLRSEVFVVEQECPYLDMDNNDQQALHVCGYTTEGLVDIRACLHRALNPIWLLSAGWSLRRSRGEPDWGGN